MYWSINTILPYQRNWNFINGVREIGKTYTTLKWLINQALLKNKSFVYICRTKTEKKHGILKAALQKVVDECFLLEDFKFSNDKVLYDNKIIAHCIAISEYIEIKKHSFPDVYYMIFDEYMIEDNNFNIYVDGWQEPEHLLSIYQTVDRGRDIVKVFLTGNNTVFYNPYHLHPAFNIPKIEPGTIWTSKNVLFQWALPTSEMSDYLNTLKINKQIKNTNYGKMAIKGEYEDNNLAITSLSSTSKYTFTILGDGLEFGIYSDLQRGMIIVSDKIDYEFPYRYAITLKDHTPNTLLLKSSIPHIKWLSRMFRLGIIKYTSASVQSKFYSILKYIIK